MAGWEESLKFPSRAHGSWIHSITSPTWSGVLGVMWKIQQTLCIWAGWRGEGRGGEVDKEGKCSQRETESKISHDSQPLVFTAPRGSPPLEHSRDLLPAKRLWQRGRDFIDGIKVPSADLALIKRRGSQLSLTLSGELSILGTEAVPCWFGEVSCQSEPADEEGRVPRACGSWDRFGLSWSWGQVVGLGWTG